MVVRTFVAVCVGPILVRCFVASFVAARSRLRSASKTVLNCSVFFVAASGCCLRLVLRCARSSPDESESEAGSGLSRLREVVLGRAPRFLKATGAGAGALSATGEDGMVVWRSMGPYVVLAKLRG